MTTSLVLVSVGNTRTRFAAALDGRLEPSHVLENSHAAGVAAAIGRAAGEREGEPTAIIASVNGPAADRLEQALKSEGVRVVRFGRDLAIPMAHTLDDASTVGQDRLLDALGAYARSKQACIVIDAGSAVTVDFVDGEGVFHGGAIAPGVAMMLRALHEHTAALPLVAMSRDLLPPMDDSQATAEVAPFGKNTAHAIALGVASAVRGLAHELIDRYAAFYRAYPRVVATGGDAPLLFETDPLVETIVPDLTLIGMLEAVERLEKLDQDEDGTEE
jgi:type III pantothenate kinase